MEWYCSFCLNDVQAVSTIRRGIGSLVIGDYDDASLSKNTLNAIQVAKDFGDVENVCSNEFYRFPCGFVEWVYPSPFAENSQRIFLSRRYSTQ